MPSQRNRILGFQMYRNQSTGFLQWAVNYYHATDSRYKIDPYFVSDAGGALEAGDSYVVYPTEGGVYESLRHEVFFEAIQDMRALQLYEDLAGRDAAISLIHQGLDYRLSMDKYPCTDKWLLDLRERLNRAIAG